MARLADIPEPTRSHLVDLPCPTYDTDPWTPGPAMKDARVALISTAGLSRRGDRPFSFDADDYRVIPGSTPAKDIVMSHISSNFDRSGFQQDFNIVFPLERLREMAEAGEIGSVAEAHYSFMGATHPDQLEKTARHLSGLLRQDNVTAAVLVPV
jgi:D-proline reductase (dithiol) PrdB